MIKPRTLPPWEELLDRFEYLPQTGQLVFKQLPIKYFASSRAMSIYNAKYPGTFAGSQKSEGYWKVEIQRVKFPLHRLIWKWVTGQEPGFQIDHEDGDVSNNRFENFREMQEQQINMQNRKLFSNNQSGHVGVRQRNSGSWSATGTYNKKRTWIGTYPTFEEAVAARQDWAKGKTFSERHGKL